MIKLLLFGRGKKVYFDLFCYTKVNLDLTFLQKEVNGMKV